MNLRRNLRNPGVALALVLLVLAAVAAAWFLARGPRAPDVFTGHVYALRLRPLGVVYLTDVEHDLLGIGVFAGLAALLVGLAAPGLVGRTRR